MPVIFPALGTLAAGLLPASKTLAGFAASAAHGSGGLLKALQDKLHAWEDTEFALQEKVRSRLHVVFVLRPYTPLDQAPAVAESPTGGAPPKPRSMLHRILFGRPRSRDTTAGSAFPDISSLSSWTGKYLLGECHEQMCRPEPKPSSVQSIDLGDGALRHEMVIVKQSGFICLDYKGVLYRILSKEGAVMPAGLTAFRVNVAYDMLRAAVQSGEFVVEADQRQLALLNSARTPTPPSAEEAPAPSTPGSVFADAGDAARSEVTRLSQADVLQGGLSEAMGPWLKVRLRAEMHCMRGADVLYASYTDTEFSKSHMMDGTRLHVLGQEDKDNPYCQFVSQNEAAILAQCQILNVVDLRADSATAGSSLENDEANAAPPGGGDLSECHQSFSRIRDIKGNIQMAKVIPWISSLTQVVSSTAAAAQKK
eukprot:jgi/Tetstr1/456536/TSEL_043258.t1